MREHIKEDIGECIRRYKFTREEKLFPALVHLELSGCGRAFSYTSEIFDQRLP